MSLNVAKSDNTAPFHSIVNRHTGNGRTTDLPQQQTTGLPKVPSLAGISRRSNGNRSKVEINGDGKNGDNNALTIDHTPDTNGHSDISIDELPKLTGYAIIKQIGSGGMGTVHLARTEDQNLVAIKLLENTENKNQAYRFGHREIAALARLDHPNVIKLIGYGTIDGKPAFVMEYIKGNRTLESSMNTLNQEYNTENVIAFLDQVIQAAHGIDAAHANKILHRDIKPSNILITPDNIVKIADFGLAKIQHPRGMHTYTTTENATIGTADFMAPEQALGANKATEKSDLYSMGVILYRAFTGRGPIDFTDCENLQDRLMAVVQNDPTHPHKLNPNIDPLLAAIMHKAVQKDPKNRHFASLKEFADALSVIKNRLEAQTTTKPVNGHTQINPPTVLSETPDRTLWE